MLCQFTYRHDRVIHVIGDSHTKAFEFQNGFVTHHIGQATAHNLIRVNNSSNSREILFTVLKGIPKKDLVLLVFGEIDARIHFYNQHVKTGKSFEVLMAETLDKYRQVLKEIRAKGYNIAVLGIPPAGSQDNIYGYPNYAGKADRIRIYAQFNKMMKTMCESNDIKFLDVQSLTRNSEGMIDEAFARDEIHLNSRIIPYLRQLL